MTDYAHWELQGWRDIYEDRDLAGNKVLAIYECDGRRCYIYRSSASGDIRHWYRGNASLIKKQPPRMYACLHRDGVVAVWRDRKNGADEYAKEPGAHVISRPADADPMDFMQWRVEE